MSPRTLALGTLLATLTLASPAHASDASLRHALTPYGSTLQTDVIYLVGFTAPAQASAPAVAARLSLIDGQLTSVARLTRAQQASTSAGKRGRSMVLSALDEELVAVKYGRVAASAAGSGQSASASAAAAHEQSSMVSSLSGLRAGAALLHLQ
jgi:hypothetical protein